MLYLTSLTAPLLSWLAIQQTGSWGILYPLTYIFFLLPLLDHFIPLRVGQVTPPKNDIPLLLVSFIYLALFIYSLFYLAETSGLELITKSIAVGISGGVIGINCAHELGHRKQPHYRLLAKVLLLTCCYMHFYTEHNKGHHRHVATPADPASARFNETLYHFLYRSIRFSFQSAYKIDAKEVKLFLLLQLTALILVGWLISLNAMVAYLFSSFMAIILLEVVNYIEHYGLARKFNGKRYEKVAPIHSWNSAHLFSAVHIFNLSLHSDHHALASKTYYQLESQPSAPELPSGYPAMMLLALIPSLWFRVMNPRIKG